MRNKVLVIEDLDNGQCRMKVLVLAIEEGGRRIRLSREKALAHEEQAETQAYIKDAARRGGFGMTLGDFLKGR